MVKKKQEQEPEHLEPKAEKALSYPDHKGFTYLDADGAPVAKQHACVVCGGAVELGKPCPTDGHRAPWWVAGCRRG